MSENNEKYIKDFEGKVVKDPVDRRLGTMPIGELLFKMSAPMIFSMFLMACYNVVDSIFVSRVSEAALSALSLAYPVQYLMIALNVGTNVGMTANTSRSLGERNFDKANSYVSHGFLLATIYSILFALFGIFLTEKYFLFQLKDPEIIKAGIDYLSIITIFSFGSFMQIVFERMLQATGKSVECMVVQITGAVFNIIFDPILIFGLFGLPALGVKGAAIATVAGQILAAIIGYFINVHFNKTIKLSFKKFVLNTKIILDIYRVGLPSIIMDSVGSISVICLNAILIKFPLAIPIIGIYYKMENFVFMPLFGLNNGMVPIVSYNYGSKNRTRLIKVIKISVMTGCVIMALGTLIFQVMPDIIFKLFVASDEMLKEGVIAFRIISTHFCIASVNIILSSVMQATRKEIYSMVSFLVRQIIFLIPLAYILSLYFTLDKVWWSIPIAEVMALIPTLVLYKKTYDTEIKPLNET